MKIFLFGMILLAGAIFADKVPSRFVSTRGGAYRPPPPNYDRLRNRWDQDQYRRAYHNRRYYNESDLSRMPKGQADSMAAYQERERRIREQEARNKYRRRP